MHRGVALIEINGLSLLFLMALGVQQSGLIVGYHAARIALKH